MSRYQAAVAEVADEISRMDGGVGLLYAPPGELWLIAGMVAEATGAIILSADEAAAAPRGTLSLHIGLPADLNPINGQRDSLFAHGGRRIFVITLEDAVRFRRGAGDVASTLLLNHEIAFEPDPTASLEDAQASLVAAMRRRFGRLDLRGLMRDESDDIDWRTDDLFVEPLATEQLPLGSPLLPAPEARPVFGLLAEAFAEGKRPLVTLLGMPGEGKSFLIRQLAQHPELAAPWLGHRPLVVLIPAPALPPNLRGLKLLRAAERLLLADGEPAAHCLQSAAAEGRLLLLLDGIDEISHEGARHQLIDAITAAQAAAPSMATIVTSRPSGCPTLPEGTRSLSLAPFTDDQVSQFLQAWCRHLAEAKQGPAAGEGGAQEGKALAAQLRGNPGVGQLARTPLLLTILAIVHRAGLQLPEHRIELYHHISRILVERWNRLRSLAPVGQSPPLRLVDAQRLLGGVGLAIVQDPRRSALTAARLESLIARSLEGPRLRTSQGPAELLALFRGTLGLLVEQGPDLYGFAHLSLAECFAAWELLRTDAFERLLGDPKEAFRPELCETLRLGVAELGQMRADDARLDKAMETMLASAKRSAPEHRMSAWALVAGVLEDAPPADAAVLQALCDWLIWDMATRQGDVFGDTGRAILSLSRVVLDTHTCQPFLRNAMQKNLEPDRLEPQLQSLATPFNFHSFLAIWGQRLGFRHDSIYAEGLKRGFQAALSVQSVDVDKVGIAKIPSYLFNFLKQSEFTNSIHGHYIMRYGRIGPPIATADIVREEGVVEESNDILARVTPPPPDSISSPRGLLTFTFNPPPASEATEDSHSSS
jgi:hypothetical protein